MNPELSKIEPSISQAQIRKIELLRSADISLAFDVIARSRTYQESIFQIIDKFRYGIAGYFGFLFAVESVRYLFCTRQRTHRRRQDIYQVP